jgi:hypothetical protein
MPDSPERTELKTWFKKVWRDTPGAVKLAFQVEKDLVWSNVMFTWPNQLDAIVEWVLAKVGQGADVFYAPAIFKDRTSGRSENVLGSWTLWTDFDGNAPENWAGGAFDEFPEPSVRIQSSTADRQHCYWFLDEFISREVLEPKNRALAYELGADTSGWDAGQVLRPPATKNYGHAKPDRKLSYPVEVISESAILYGPSIIETPTHFVDIVKNAIDLTNLPDLAYVLAKGKWSDSFYESYFAEQAPSKGDRSTALMEVGYFGAEAGLSDSEIYVLVETADSRWGKYTTRTPDRRFAILCDIVERARFKHPVGSDVDFLANFSKPRAATQIVYTNREFLDLKVEQKWVIENLMTEHGMGMIGGEPGVGKTQLSNWLGIAMSSGNNFLTWKNSCGPLRTMLLSLEMPLVGMQRFLESAESNLGKPQRDLLDQNLLISPLNSALPLDLDAGRKFLIDLTKNYRPQVIVIDSLAKSTTKSLNEDVPARLLNNWLQEFRNSFGVSVVLVHHTRKGVTGGKKAIDLNVLDELLGNRYLTGDLDFVLGCYKIRGEKGRIRVRNAKNRYAQEHPDITISRQSDLTFKVDQIHDGEDSDTGETLLGDFLKGLKKTDD